MVTEADSVTFAGTLELLAYYREQLSAASNNSDAFVVKKPEDRSLNAKPSKENSVRFIINRLPSKYSFDGLEKLYRPYFTSFLGILSHDKSIFSYIPADELMSSGFGEYPFHVPLAPKSIFSLKTKLICYDLLNRKFDLVGSKTLKMKRYRLERYRCKINRKVTSREQDNISSIMNFYAWSSIVVLLLLSTGTIFALLSSPIALERALESTPVYRVYLLSIVLVSLMPLIWYLFKGMFGIMMYLFHEI